MLSFDDQYTRRLPIYLLLDVSESMVGEPLKALEDGVKQLLADLRDNPMAVETAYMSMIIFSNKAKQIVPLQCILAINLPHLTVGPGTHVGEAFALLADAIQRETHKATPTRKADWKPLIFLLTDGAPTDDWRDGYSKFQGAVGSAITNFTAVACGPDSDLGLLKSITPNVLMMESATPGAFATFFQWVSASVSTASVGIGSKGKYAHIPPPPTALRVIADVPKMSKGLPQQNILAVTCTKTKQVYLMRYRREDRVSGTYRAVGAYPVGRDYLSEAESSRASASVDSSQLDGSVPCPYCGNPGWRATSEGVGLECHPHLSLTTGLAQIMFVLDVTGSMSGEISGVKNGMRGFVDQINSDDLSVEVGLLAFRDLRVGEYPEILSFDGNSFTQNVEQFKGAISRLRAKGGGGNRCESSFDALLQASRQPFSADSQRILILITDQPPWLPDGEIREREDLIRALKNASIDQLYIVVPARVMSDYEFLNEAFKGEMLELGEKGRGSQALTKMLESIGKSVRLTVREG